MPPLPVISGDDCIRALERAGFSVARQSGSHITLRRTNPAPTATVVVPKHRVLDRGTLRSIIRMSGLTVQEFIDLV